MNGTVQAFFRRPVTLATFALAALTLPGCSLIRSWFPPRPLPPIASHVAGLAEIAIVPVAAASADDSLRWTEHLERQLLCIDGIERVRLVTPEQVRARTGNPPELGSAQGLLSVAVLRYDPFYPPSAHLEIALYAPDRQPAPDRTLLALERNGHANGEESTQRSPWVRFQTVIRADDAAVNRRLLAHARAQADEDRGLDGFDRLTRISDRFIDFALHEALARTFGRIEEGRPDGH